MLDIFLNFVYDSSYHFFKEKMLLRRLRPTFTPSIKLIQADHAIDIDHGTRICLNSFNTRDKIRTQNPTKLQ